MYAESVLVDLVILLDGGDASIGTWTPVGVLPAILSAAQEGTHLDDIADELLIAILLRPLIVVKFILLRKV